MLHPSLSLHPPLHVCIVLVAPHAHPHHHRRIGCDFPSGDRERDRSIKREPMTPLISGNVRQNDRSYISKYPVEAAITRNSIIVLSSCCSAQHLYPALLHNILGSGVASRFQHIQGGLFSTLQSMRF